MKRHLHTPLCDQHEHKQNVWKFFSADSYCYYLISSAKFDSNFIHRLYFSQNTNIWSSWDYPWWLCLPGWPKNWRDEWKSPLQGHFAWSNLELSALLEGTIEVLHGSPLGVIKQRLW